MTAPAPVTFKIGDLARFRLPNGWSTIRITEVDLWEFRQPAVKGEDVSPFRKGEINTVSLSLLRPVKGVR